MSATIEEALRQAKDIEKGVQEFFDKVNGMLEWVPDIVADLVRPIQEGLRRLNEKISEFGPRSKSSWTTPAAPPNCSGMPKH